MNKISIALCTYNGARYLNAQLDSFAAQTRLPDELIVCDDCSTDETIKILKDFSENVKFPVKICINEKNLGSIKNFERAISLCSGDIIFLSDQDDVWHSEKIAKIEARFLETPELGMVFTNGNLIDENSKPLGSTLWDYSFNLPELNIAKQGKISDVLLKQSTVTGATMAFRAKFRDNFIPIPDDIPNLIHDEWIALVISSQGAIGFIEESLIQYRQHSNQQMGIIENIDVVENQSLREKYETTIRYYQKTERKLTAASEKFKQLKNWKSEAAKKKFFDRIDFFINQNHEIIEHCLMRKSLPNNHFKRILPVWKELKTGRYQLYSKGLLSAIKDITQSRQNPNEQAKEDS